MENKVSTWYLVPFHSHLYMSPWVGFMSEETYLIFLAVDLHCSIVMFLVCIAPVNHKVVST